MLQLFNYSFIVRGLEAGMIVALICPLIGLFLVLRRYSLIADTLSHVSLTGIAIGLITKIDPLITALITTVLSSLIIDRLRLAKKVYGESALSIFLSGSLALAILLISVGRGFNVNLFNYLFGSLVTVKQTEIYLIALLGLVVFAVISLFFEELFFIAFDEEAARVSGLPVGFINTLFIIITAIAITMSIPVVGILLISALVVIPAVTALQLQKSFLTTIIWAEVISVVSVVAGIFAAFYLNLPTGGSTVLVVLTIFVLTLLFKSHK